MKAKIVGKIILPGMEEPKGFDDSGLKKEWEDNANKLLEIIREIDENDSADNVKNLNRLNKIINENKTSKINWSEIFTPQLTASISALEKNGDKTIDGLKKVYTAFRQEVVNAAQSAREKLVANYSKNKTPEEEIKGIEQRILVQRKLWSDYKSYHLGKIEKMVFKSLKDSRDSHKNHVEDAKEVMKLETNIAGRYAARDNFLNLLKDMRALKYDEAEIEQLKKDYIESLEEIVQAIDKRLLDIKEPVPNELPLGWYKKANKTLSELSNKSLDELNILEEKLQKEIDEINGGIYPDLIKTIIENADDGKKKEIINEALGIKNRILLAVVDRKKSNSVTGSSSQVNTQAATLNPDDNPVSGVDPDKQALDDAEKNGDAVRDKIGQWKSAASAFLDAFKVADDIEIPKNIDQAVPKNIDKYLKTLKIDDFAKDKLREEHAKIREELLAEIKNIIEQRKNKNTEPSIVVEANKDELLDMIASRVEIWKNHTNASLLECGTKTAPELRSYINRKKKKTQSLIDDWDKNAPKSIKSFIDKIKAKDVSRATQIKNDYLLLQESLIEDALAILTALEGGQNANAAGVNEPLVAPKEKKEIDRAVIDRFEQELNIAKTDLEKINGFDELSKAQQLLVLNNLQQLMLGRVEEEGANRLKTEQEGQTLLGSKFLARIKNAITNKYQTAKAEKQVAKEYKKGGIDMHKLTLEKLTSGFLVYGPEASVDSDGKIKMHFSKELGFIPHNKEQKELLLNFDSIAQEFAELPDEWLYDTANVEHRAKYMLVRRKYQGIKDKLLEEIKEEVGKKEAIIKMVKADAKVQMNQFMNSHPDAVNELEGMVNEKILTKAVLKTIGEKGIYASIGFVAKSVAVSAFSLLGAPLAAAGLGAGFAWRRAVKNLEKNDKLARRGAENIGSKSRDYADAKYYNESIEFLLDEIDREATLGTDNKISDKKAELLRSLRWHFEEAEKKKMKGEINYGAHENGDELRIGNQYRFMENMSKAAVKLGYYNLYDGSDRGNDKVNEEFFKYQSEYNKGLNYPLSGARLDADHKENYNVEAEEYFKKIFEAYKQDKQVINVYLRKQWFDKIATRSFFQGKTAATGATTAASFALLGMAARAAADDNSDLSEYLKDSSKAIDKIQAEESAVVYDKEKYSQVESGQIDSKLKGIEGNDEVITDLRKAIESGATQAPSESDEASVKWMNKDYPSFVSTEGELGYDPIVAKIVIPETDAPQPPLDYKENIVARQATVKTVLPSSASVSEPDLMPSTTNSDASFLETKTNLKPLDRTSSGISEQQALNENLETEKPVAEAPEPQKLDTEQLNQLKLATIQKGHGANSIEGVFIKQLSADPAKFGFKGDIDDADEVRRWAGGQAHRIAIQNGYFDPKTGEGIRMKGSSIDHNAYLLKEVNGKIGVDEYVNGALRESKVPGVGFENGDIESNEYIYDEVKRQVSGSGPISPEANSPSAETKTSQAVFAPDKNPVKIAEPKIEAPVAVSQINPEIEKKLEIYRKLYGISRDDIEKAGIKVEEVMDPKETEKLNYLRMHQGNMEKGVEVVKMASDLGASLDMVQENYYQLKDLEGNIDRQNGLLAVLEDRNYKEGYAQIFGLNIYDYQIKTDNNVTTIKDVVPGYNLVVENDGKKITFGVKGPFGKSISNEGRVFRFRADMELNNENIDKISKEIDRLNGEST